ncbi:hypothetical protein ACFE04_019585 [Oxalis oulophora]
MDEISVQRKATSKRRLKRKGGESFTLGESASSCESLGPANAASQALSDSDLELPMIQILQMDEIACLSMSGVGKVVFLLSKSESVKAMKFLFGTRSALPFRSKNPRHMEMGQLFQLQGIFRTIPSASRKADSDAALTAIVEGRRASSSKSFSQHFSI